MITSVTYKKMMRWVLSVVVPVFVLIFGLSLTTQAAPEDIVNWDSLCVYGEENLINTKISPQTIKGEKYLVMPSNISPDEVKFNVEIDASAVILAKGSKDSVQLTVNEPMNLTALCGESDTYDLTLLAVKGFETSEFKVKIIFSGNVNAMYLVSDDPVNKGRNWVESSADKSNKATGSMVMQNPDGTVVYDGALTQIKGRGNSTWSLVKKPYQIKLDKKTDLLQTDDKGNQSKTWILLANYSDGSLIRNTLALNLGVAMDMDSYIQSTYVDLYYDAEYRGSYLLTEKVEIGSGRVDITDLEEMNEEVNPNTDLEELEIAEGTTANGASYRYCVGMKSPEDITGGYLLEMEASYRAVNEVCYFWTTRGEYVVVKSPEFCSKEQMDYIASIYQEYEDAVYNGGMNPSTGKHYTEYVDLKSTVQCYLINELTKNPDGFQTSAYLYKEAGEDIMTMGPLWDYDLGFGSGAGVEAQIKLQKDPEGLYTARSIYGHALYELDDFRVAAKEEWQNTLYPLLTDVVLGDKTAVSTNGALHSTAYYRQLLKQTGICDTRLWRDASNSEGWWLNQVDYVTNYIKARTASLNDIISGWNADSCEPIPTYIDVETGAWYYTSVSKAKEYGLMKGVGNNLEIYPMFDPTGDTTRAAVAQTIYNMALPGKVEYKETFTDVPNGKWYTAAVIWGADNNIIQGYPGNIFMPNKTITREELVTLLYRYSGEGAPNSNKLSKYNDASSVSNFAKVAMEWAISEEIIQGDPGDILAPKRTTSRAELATILVRYYEKMVLNAE